MLFFLQEMAVGLKADRSPLHPVQHLEPSIINTGERTKEKYLDHVQRNCGVLHSPESREYINSGTEKSTSDRESTSS